MAMMNALSSAVTGLKSEQTALDVIANNISNVNTTGYKAQTVSFEDLLSQTISAASGSTATTGSVNAQQVGLGVSIASTDTDMTVGSTSTTSNSTDVALTGAGYLIVQTGTTGEYEFTRDGSLSIDSEGNLTVDGKEVCGWEAFTLDSDGNKVYTTTGSVEPLNVYSDTESGNKKVLAAEATTAATVTGTLDSSSDVVSGATLQDIGSTAISSWDGTTTVNVYDEQGNKTAVTINYKKCATENSTTSWYWEASGTDATISPSSGYIAFDSDGTMVSSVTPLTTAIGSNTGTSTLDALGAAVTTASDSTVTSDYQAYAAALAAYTAAGGATQTNAATLVTAKSTLDSAISSLGNTTLSTALTTYNTKAGTAINTAATTEKSSDSAANEAAVTTAVATATGSALDTFEAAVETVNNTTLTSDYKTYADALTAYKTTASQANAAALVTAKTALDSEISSLGNTTLSAALTTYNTAAGTAINTAAKTEESTDSTTNEAAVTTAIAAATAAKTGYTDSDITVSTGLTAGTYTVAVADSTTTSGDYTVTLTDTSGKTYSTTSSDGSATFKTSSGTVTLTAPTSIEDGSMSFTVTEGTALTFNSTPTLAVTNTTDGTQAASVKLDMSDITSTSGTGTLTGTNTDGYASGTAESYSIATDGTISAKYSNGKTKSIGQIALAVFENPSGLEKAGDNFYTTSTSSGSYSTVVAGEGGSGTMTSYALELSNVDLASQFSQMMTSQRAYQANAKVITTGSEMLQSLINMVT
ncbi:MAG: flagellar hook-basal body complex protein [Veillonellales bacterium]